MVKTLKLGENAKDVNNRGFTLIETLVYLALFALIIGGVVVSAYALFETSGYNQTAAMLQEEQNFLLARFAQVVEGAESIETPAVGASGSILAGTAYDGTSVSIAGSGGALTLAGEQLNNTNVFVSDVTFTHIESPEGVTLSLTLSARTPEGRTIRRNALLTAYLHK